MRGYSFELVAYKSAWGEDRVYLYDQQQQLIALPASWTNVIAVAPFVAVADGRSLFQAEELLDLSEMVRRWSSAKRRQCVK